MAGKLVPLGHKAGAEREVSRVRAVQASALAEGRAGAVPGSADAADPYRRQRNARAQYASRQAATARRIYNARHSSAHLRPATVQNRKTAGRSGINSNEQMAFGSRG